MGLVALLHMGPSRLGVEPASPALAGGLFTTATREALYHILDFTHESCHVIFVFLFLFFFDNYLRPLLTGACSLLTFFLNQAVNFYYKLKMRFLKIST